MNCYQNNQRCVTRVMQSVSTYEPMRTDRAQKSVYTTRKTVTPLWTRARAETPAPSRSCRHWVRRLGIRHPGQPDDWPRTQRARVCLKERKRGLGVMSVCCLRLEAICSSEWSTMSPVTWQKLFSSHWLSRQQVSPCFPPELSVNTSYPNTSSPYMLMVKLILLSFMYLISLSVT